MQTAEEALAALKTGDPIHVSGKEMRQFITAVTVRRSVMTEQAQGCTLTGKCPTEADTSMGLGPTKEGG